ncbi:MAG: hypothetical protein ACI8P3_003220 [Saprospiraceae bacterium]
MNVKTTVLKFHVIPTRKRDIKLNPINVIFLL